MTFCFFPLSSPPAPRFIVYLKLQTLCGFSTDCETEIGPLSDSPQVRPFSVLPIWVIISATTHGQKKEVAEEGHEEGGGQAGHRVQLSEVQLSQVL